MIRGYLEFTASTSSLTAPPPPPEISVSFIVRKKEQNTQRHLPCSKQGSDTMDINQTVFEEYIDEIDLIR
jgi:hypothetical protein